MSGLSRDPAGAVNALGKIFDKKTVQERQELAQVFGEEAFKAVGNLGLKPGSPEKATIDAVLGGIMAQLGGSSFVSGAASAGFSQILQSELSKIQDPAMRQWASAIIGAAAAGVAGGDIQAGASVAVGEIRNNDFEHVIYLAKLIKENPQLATTMLVAGLSVQMINEQQQLVDNSGKVVAYCNPGGNWLDSAGSLIGDLKTWVSNTFSPPATDTSGGQATVPPGTSTDKPSTGSGTTLEGQQQGSTTTSMPSDPIGNTSPPPIILDNTTDGTEVITASTIGRNGALNQAKRDAGIPSSQQPDYVELVPMRSAPYEGGNVIKDASGNVIYTREYHYTNSNGQEIVIQEHSAGHEKGDQGSHFNVRPADNTRTGSVPGTQDHYSY
ncbi:HNH/endonuclease VII fold putative polymorphic toxin [Sporomusa malonica]|uniref:HNH/endonuclease VII fold putative polymorphic toxin n=1 Tax=Sporomusa malonica TaxID=112901 RepID=UPI0026869329